tara:strand:+ start:620 stop:856 length:237 start_codon:yes stop_codon:yes gene_type:complete
MSKVYEHKYMVFQIEEGPKAITESLNAYGQEGWALTNMVIINDGANVVAWLVKETTIEAPDPKKTKDSKTMALWTDGE